MDNHFDKPCHLIFLDIDGVLRPDRAYDGKLQKTPIEHVKKIARKFNSRIVITSTWRDIHSWQTFNRPDIFDGLVIGETPDLDPTHGDNGRYREVLAWLKQTGNQDVPWIALDDKQVHYPDLPNVFMTNPATGLDQEITNRILKGSPIKNEGRPDEEQAFAEILGPDLHKKVTDYASSRNISGRVALRQLATAGYFVINE